jgi:hypothetical protein
MEHNQHLNEILYLISTYYDDEKITTNDLAEIKNLANRVSEASFTPTKIDVIPITDKVAKKYLDKFNKYFYFHPQLTKKFRVKSTLFSESIQRREKIILRLIQNGTSLELAYLVGGQAFLIDCENDLLTLITDLNTLEKGFDDGFGQNLDTNLKYISNGNKIANTRKIMINYYGNFDELTVGDDYIYFLPAIIDDYADSNNHQFTFIMFFGEKIDLLSKIQITINDTYYDTFQLCPPNC